MRRFGYLFLIFNLLEARVLSQAPPTLPVPNSAAPSLNTLQQVNAPKAIHTQLAKLPEEAVKRGINGKCAVSFQVDVKGLPQNVHVARCSDPIFAENSLEAVSNYRFKPATKTDGTPVAVPVQLIISFQWTGAKIFVDPIRCRITSPPGVLSSTSGPGGVYPLTKVDVPPKFAEFVDQGYGSMAFSTAGESACDVVLTVSLTGKPSNPVVTHCDHAGFEEVAVKSLMSSKYKPGSLNGQPISIRSTIHIEYGDSPGQN